MSETGGLVIGGAGLALFAAAAVAAMTDTLDDVVVWGLGAQTVAEFQRWALIVIVVAALVGLARLAPRGGRGAHGSTHAHGMAANGDGSCPRPLMQHERAHQRTCRRVGGGGSTIETWRAGGWWYGRTVFHNPARVAALPPKKQIEIYAAGRRAAPSTSSPDDEAQIARLRGMRTDR